ncbi:MAG TPA: VanW family protein [Rubrobacteraceae bacterium]|nr:VanW family protein [Rubrobacteraceae bacterium]
MKETSKRGGPRAARREERGFGGPGFGPNGYESRRVERSAYRVHKRGIYAARRRKVATFALAGCVLVAAAIFAYGLFGGDDITGGVRVGEVDVGGMTREEARAAVESHAADAFAEVSLGDAGTLSGEDLGVKVDAAAAVDEAYSVGRTGWVGGRLFEVARSYLVGVQVEPELAYDREAARAAVENLAGEFHRDPRNATFRVGDDGEIEVREAREGRVLDQEGTLEDLDGALTNLSNEVRLAEGPAPKPSVTTQEIQDIRPTEKLGEFKTDFLWDSNPGRQANMKLAAGAVNNTVVAPGDVFSFNELTMDLKYEQAKTFSEGGVAYADGGGLCQVSSTLYMAANYAGLEIVERHPHFAVLPYIKPGFDATVWFGDEGGWGVLDMKFKNNTDGYILIREWVDSDGFLNAEIHGRPTGKKVEMRTEKVFEDPNRGIKWATYKTVKNEDGEVIQDGLLHDYIYGYNPPSPDGGPHYETSTPRVSGWNDPTNTTGWAEVE